MNISAPAFPPTPECIQGDSLSPNPTEMPFGRKRRTRSLQRDLLGYLAAHAGRPVTRSELLRHVWQLNPERVLTRTIDMHVALLRQTLCERPRRPKRLLTVRGQGYMLLPGALEAAA